MHLTLRSSNIWLAVDGIYVFSVNVGINIAGVSIKLDLRALFKKLLVQLARNTYTHRVLSKCFNPSALSSIAACNTFFAGLTLDGGICLAVKLLT